MCVNLLQRYNMKNDYLNLYQNAEELAMRNSGLIEILSGYCEGKMPGGTCDIDAIYELCEILKQNQDAFITELDNSDTKLSGMLFELGLIKTS